MNRQNPLFISLCDTARLHLTQKILPRVMAIAVFSLIHMAITAAFVVPPMVMAAEPADSSGESTEDQGSPSAETPGETTDEELQDPVDEDPSEADPEEEDSGDDADSEDNSGDIDEDDADVAYELEREFTFTDDESNSPLAKFAVLDNQKGSGKRSGSLRKLGLTRELTPLVGDTGSTAEEPGDDQSENDEGQVLQLPPAPLPRYAEGDTFVYSDGSWERVVKVIEGLIEWRNHRGFISAGVPDFTYQRSSWQSRSRSGHRTFKQTSYLFGKKTTTIWPLAKGNTTRFDEIGRWQGFENVEHRYDAFWNCNVLGTKQAVLAAGEFAGWQIRCGRYGDSFSYSKGARAYRTWLYVPEMQHWVVEFRENQGSRPNKKRELVAVMPDLSLFAGTVEIASRIQQQFQEVLEGYKRNENDLWLSANGDVSVDMTPGKRFKHQDGPICRQYQQRIQAENKDKTYFGIACRSEDGYWRIPRK